MSCIVFGNNNAHGSEMDMPWLFLYMNTLKSSNWEKNSKCHLKNIHFVVELSNRQHFFKCHILIGLAIMDAWYWKNLFSV